MICFYYYFTKILTKNSFIIFNTLYLLEILYFLNIIVNVNHVTVFEKERLLNANEPSSL